MGEHEKNRPGELDLGDGGSVEPAPGGPGTTTKNPALLTHPWVAFVGRPGSGGQ
jgi:hypothetical protein